MSLQIRRGTAAEVATITPELGEPIYVTDDQSLVIGDGSTQGGIAVTSNLQTISVAQDTEEGHNVAIMYNNDNTGTIRLANLDNDYSLTVGSTGTLVAGPLSVSSTASFAGNIDGTEGFTANMTGFRAGYYGGTAGYAFKNDTDTGMFGWGASDLRFRVDGENTALVDGTEWSFQNNISVAYTATVTTLKFGDGTEMTTAATGGGGVAGDQSVYTTSSVRFEVVNVGTGTTSFGTVYDNDASMLLTAEQGVYISAPYGLNIDSNTALGNLGSKLQVNYIQTSGTATEVTVDSQLKINNTLTVQAAFMGLNTGTNWRNFGYGFMPYNANNMKIELPNNGSSLFFAFKNPGGAERNVGFSRQGNIVLQNGNIGNGFPNGISLNSQDGGPAFVGVSTTTDGVLYSSRVGANTSTGVFQTVQTNAGVDFSTLLDYNGTFTVPRDLVVTTTATVASLSVTNTATANEVVVGADLVAIKSQGYNVIGVDNNWRVGNVLEVGTGDGQGYITSTGNNSLKLQSSANDGPGGSIDIGYGDGAGVSLYSGNSQEFNTAFFNTTSNTINYGLTVNGNTTINGITTVNSATTFNADPVVNVNNTLTLAGMTIGVSNAVLIPNLITSSATNVLVQTPPTNGGAIIFNMNRFGVQRPLAITRTGGIAFDFGQQISPGQGANVGQLLIQAAVTATGTANTLNLTSGGDFTGVRTRAVFSDASGLTIGTRPSGGATAFNSSVFDLNGGLTLPKSLAVGTTATVSTTMILPVYTVAGLTAITGVVGSIAVVSDSTPGGMMAFWDTTNSRWSYVHDNSAV